MINDKTKQDKNQQTTTEFESFGLKAWKSRCLPEMTDDEVSSPGFLYSFSSPNSKTHRVLEILTAHLHHLASSPTPKHPQTRYIAFTGKIRRKSA